MCTGNFKTPSVVREGRQFLKIELLPFVMCKTDDGRPLNCFHLKTRTFRDCLLGIIYVMVNGDGNARRFHFAARVLHFSTKLILKLHKQCDFSFWVEQEMFRNYFYNETVKKKKQERFLLNQFCHFIVIQTWIIVETWNFHQIRLIPAITQHNENFKLV